MLLTGTVPALKNRFLGHFCVTDRQTHRLTNSQTHKRTDGKQELHSCMSQLKKFFGEHLRKKKKKSKKKIYIYIYIFFFFEKIYRGKLSKLSVSYYVLIKKSSFLGHFCVTHSQTHKLTNGRTESRNYIAACRS